MFYKHLPKYNPQMFKGKAYTKNHKNRDNTVYGKYKSCKTVNKGERFPQDVITFGRDKEKFHPTQKPVKLFEYIIKTYTDPGDLVLDNCAGSGTTGVACSNLGRDCIMIEKDPGYCEKIRKRMSNCKTQVNQVDLNNFVS